MFKKQKKENSLREKLLTELAIHKAFATILEKHLEELIDALNEQLKKGELNIDIIELSDFQGKFDAISEKEEEAILVEEKIEKELNDKTALLSSLSNKAIALTERANTLVYFVGGTILIALFINLFKNDDELNFKTLKYLFPASLISALLLVIFLVY